MWASWISRLRNALNRQRQFHVVVVKPNDSTNPGNGEKNYIETQHLKTFHDIWRLIDLMAFVVGVSAFREVNINARMVLTASMIAVSYPSIFYTLFVVWPNFPLLLELICIFGALIPGTLKFKLILKDVKQILWMNRFFENILSDHPIGRRSDDLAKEMKDAYKKCKIFVAVSILCFAVFVLYPMYAYVTEARLVPIMRIEFPFVDQTNTKGYLIGLTFMLCFGFLGLVGNVAFDLAVLNLLMEFRSLVTLLLHDLEDYHEVSKNRNTYSTHYQDSFLKNICMKYNDIHSYLRTFQRTFGAITFHSICSLYASLICSVYSSLNNGWISGYGYCLFCFIQLYVQCILGTFVNIHNDRMSQAFYLTPWNEHPLRVQKIFLMLMHASTFNAIKLRVGPYARLNVETGLKITKSIFSYYTAISSLT